MLTLEQKDQLSNRNTKQTSKQSLKSSKSKIIKEKNEDENVINEKQLENNTNIELKETIVEFEQEKEIRFGLYLIYNDFFFFCCKFDFFRKQFIKFNNHNNNC